jgi:ABC-type glycerol-3-phosphate transport system substrate-binding protein
MTRGTKHLRRWSIWSALVLAFVVAGCTGGTAPASGGATGDVTVQFNILGYSPNTPKLYQKAIDDFQAANPGIKVVLSNGSWDTAHEKILSWINTGDSPDITVLGPKWLPELIDLDGLQPFDSYLSAGFTDNFSPSLMEPLTVDGKIYSIPEALSTRMMYYRTDLFEAAGITSPPKTWAEFVTALKAAQTPPDVYGIAIQGAGDESVWNYTYFMLGAGGYFTNEAGDWAINQPANVEALQYEVDLVSKDKVSPPDPTAVDQDTVQALFTSGKAATYFGPPWTLPSIDAAIKDKVAIAPYPTKDGSPAPLYIQDSFVLFKNAKHPAEATKFLEFWSQDKYQVEFNTVESLIPVTTSAGADPAFADNASLQAFVAAIPDARSYPLKIGWETVNVELRNAIQAALLGQKTPQQALDDAQAAIDAKAP